MVQPTFIEILVLFHVGGLFVCCFLANDSTTLVSLGLIIVKVLRLHSDTPYPIGLLWMSDRPVTETST
jgi:hypothetical protein